MYIKYLHLSLRACVKNYIPQSRVIKDNRTNEIYSAVSFTTMQLPCFNEYRELFYELNKKIVPENINKMLTARGLAFWIMDDGSKQGSGLHISVYGFSNQDVDKLMFTLPLGPGLGPLGLGRRAR